MKAQLVKSLTDSVDSVDCQKQLMHVLVCLLYNYVREIYGESCIIFDGYE